MRRPYPWGAEPSISIPIRRLTPKGNDRNNNQNAGVLGGCACGVSRRAGRHLDLIVLAGHQEHIASVIAHIPNGTPKEDQRFGAFFFVSSVLLYDWRSYRSDPLNILGFTDRSGTQPKGEPLSLSTRWIRKEWV